MPFDFANWESQARKGLLEFVLLAVLQRGERYGYDLVREAQAALNTRIVEGTVYPILQRLHRDELVASRWSVDTAAQPRKYYRITTEGSAALLRMRELWQQLAHSLQALAEGA